MPELVPISEAKGRLSELVRNSDEHDVVLMRHGRPAAVILSARRHRELMEQLDDMEDRLAVHERDGMTMSYDALPRRAGLRRRGSRHIELTP